MSKSRFLIAGFFLGCSLMFLMREVCAERILSMDDSGVKVGQTGQMVLDNGLNILTRHVPDSGLVCLLSMVESGSTTEGKYTGSGISHFVEHMLFKGTAARGVGVIPAQIKSYGGQIDAWTSFDYTAYQIVVLKEYLPQAAEVLADVLQNSAFEEEEFAKEKDVILREINMDEDDPGRKISRMFFSTAYTTHLYRHPVIGYEEVFKKLTRQDLLDYYKTRYIPGNTVLALTGDFNPQTDLTQIKNIFGGWPPKPRQILTRPQEPEQLSIREAIEPFEVEMCYLEIGFQGPALNDKELFAMDVLAGILGGDSESRLFKLLVEKKQLVSSINCWSYTPKDKGLFGIDVRLMDAKDMNQVLNLSLDQIKKLIDKGVTSREIKRAQRHVLSEYIWDLETSASQARDISTGFVLTGNPDFSERYVRGINNVLGKDVVAAARKYLRSDNYIKVAIVPKDKNAQQAQPPAKGKERQKKQETENISQDRPVSPEERTGDPKENREYEAHRDKLVNFNSDQNAIGQTERVELANGLVLVLKPDCRLPRCSVNAVFVGGLMVEAAQNNGISNLAVHMLGRGTKKRDRARLVREISELAGDVNFYSGNNSSGIKINILSPDLDKSLELLSDMIFNSVFTEEEIRKEKELITADIRRMEDDNFRVCHRCLKEVMFEDHPFKMPSSGTEESVNSITRKQLLEFHKTFFIPKNLTLSVFGDFEKEKLLKKIKKYFTAGKDPDTGQRKETLPAPEGIKLKTNNPALVEILKRQGYSVDTYNRALSKEKTALDILLETNNISEPVQKRAHLITKVMDRQQIVLMFGFPLYDLYNQDRFAFNIVDATISGHSSRLFDRIREKLGLAYMIGGFEVIGLDTGYYVIYAAVAPEASCKAQEEILKQIALVKKEGLSKEEIEASRNEFLGKIRMQREAISEQAFSSALDELYGLGYNFQQELEEQILAVSPETIKEVLKKYFDPQDFYLAIVGPEIVSGDSHPSK